MVSISRRSSVSAGSELSQTFEDALESHPASSLHFSPEEEAKLLDESNGIKADANSQFGHGEYSQAVGTYDRALAACPNYLDYEVAVLRSNVAACHLKLADWKAAVESATQGLDALDRAEGKTKMKDKKGRKAASNAESKDGNDDDDDENDKDGDSKNESTSTARAKTSGDDNNSSQQVVVELDDDDADADEEAQLRALRLSDERREQTGKLRVKLLLRRARGNQEQNGWSTLSAAEADYRELVSTTTTTTAFLPDRDRRFVTTQLAQLPARVKDAQEREVGEMMGKLKDLGNSFLKPFGLSTENFKMVKDEKTGGYSMNFEGGGGGGSSK